VPEYAVRKCTQCGFSFLDGERSTELEQKKYQCDHFEEGYLQWMDIDSIVGEQIESVSKD
jgi:hypothetical protein